MTAQNPAAKNAAEMEHEMDYIFHDMNGSCGHEETLASSPETIEEDLRDWLREGDWGEIESTIWLDARGWPVSAEDGDGHVDRDDRVDVTVALDPPEPKCDGPTGAHAWAETRVVGHGGGVICTEQCRACGLEMTTDTWAHRPDTGEQGLRSVEYQGAVDSEGHIATVLSAVAGREGYEWSSDDAEFSGTILEYLDGWYSVCAGPYGDVAERYETEAAARVAMVESIEDITAVFS